MHPIHVGKTADRAVVGIMVDFAHMVPYHLERNAWDDTTLPFVEAKLAMTPCFSSRPLAETVLPDAATPRLLGLRWGSG